MSRDPDMARLDEVMELLYWLEGEGLEADATLGQVARFLTYPEAEVAAILQRLCERGDVEPESGDPARFRLTAIGKKEGGRRFKETFQELLSQGHGECNDPECDCMDDPASCRHHQHHTAEGGSQR